MLNDETIALIEQQISYYRQHTIEAMLVKHPGFVVDDYKKLLVALGEDLGNA